MSAQPLEVMLSSILAPSTGVKQLPQLCSYVDALEQSHQAEIRLLRQIVFHLMLQAQGIESKDVGRYVPELLLRANDWTPDKPRYRDGIDWKTGEPRYETIHGKKTGKIAGVVLRNGTPVKFNEAVTDWRPENERR